MMCCEMVPTPRLELATQEPKPEEVKTILPIFHWTVLPLRARKSISVTNEVRVELYHQAQYNQCVTIIDLRTLSAWPRFLLPCLCCLSLLSIGSCHRPAWLAPRAVTRPSKFSGICV